ncbi:MAG: hypothetical protein KKD92_06240 [Proteobacteria bacterium]|nr:hypothetical protein [Pseudomonadota bacterium]
MSSTTDLNIVLIQGSAVKEIQNVRKQTLDLNQQYVAQHTESMKKQEKEKVPELKPGDRVEIKNENEKKNLKDRKQEQKDPEEDTFEEEAAPSGDHIIDITV